MTPALPTKFVESSFRQRAVPIHVARPVECDKEPPLALLSEAPGIEKPAMQKLLDELVEPPAAAEAAPDAPAVPTEVGSSDGFGGFPIGTGGGGGFYGGGPVPPGGPPGGPPTEPPVTPPDVPVVNPPPTEPPPGGPPTEPPVGPPGGPPVGPPDGPPTGPPTGPPVGPPEEPPVGPPVGPPTPPSTPVPEPATWAMLILGYFGLGAALRSARLLAARRAKA